MKPAPAFDCARCHRRIGKSTTHYLIEGGRVVCVRCLTGPRTLTCSRPVTLAGTTSSTTRAPVAPAQASPHTLESGRDYAGHTQTTRLDGPGGQQ